MQSRVDATNFPSYKLLSLMFMVANRLKGTMNTWDILRSNYHRIFRIGYRSLKYVCEYMMFHEHYENVFEFGVFMNMYDEIIEEDMNLDNIFGVNLRLGIEPRNAAKALHIYVRDTADIYLLIRHDRVDFLEYLVSNDIVDDSYRYSRHFTTAYIFGSYKCLKLLMDNKEFQQ